LTIKLIRIMLISMDVTTLYNIVKAAAEAATNSANLKTQPVNSDFMLYGTYPVYIQQYNELLPNVYKLFGVEAQELFKPIDLGKNINPADTLGSFWKTYLDLAVVKLNTLVAYLQSKIPTVQREIQAVIDFITANLRPSIYDNPKNERELQNIVEVMLRARDYDYRREFIRIPYSSKTYIPDFTLETLHLALEMKLCISQARVKEMIDEINGDIPPYQTRYENVIFAIYDLGFIRDVAEFKGSIEKNLNVYVIVTKK
jgi:hypothetical protein